MEYASAKNDEEASDALVEGSQGDIIKGKVKVKKRATLYTGNGRINTSNWCYEGCGL